MKNGGKLAKKRRIFFKNIYFNGNKDNQHVLDIVIHPSPIPVCSEAEP